GRSSRLILWGAAGALWLLLGGLRGYGVAQLLDGAVERFDVALLGPVFLGPHLEPSKLDRVGLVAHLAGRNLDDRAFFGVERVQHFALEVLQKTGLKVDIDLHRKCTSIT